MTKGATDEHHCESQNSPLMKSKKMGTEARTVGGFECLIADYVSNTDRYWIAELRETKASTAAADVDVEMTDAATNESDISGATPPAKGTNNEQLASQNKQKNAKAEKSPARPGRMYREEPPAKEELAAWTKFGSRKRLTNAQAKILVLERMEQAKKDRQEEIDAPEDMVEDEDLKRRFMKGEPRDYSIKEGD